MRWHNQKQRQWDKAVRRRPQQNRMSNHETSSSPETRTRSRGYRPAIVLIAVLVAVVVGVVLKNAREQQTAINALEQTTGENPGPADPK
jgi:hypothetical protein